MKTANHQQFLCIRGERGNIGFISMTPHTGVAVNAARVISLLCLLQTWTVLDFIPPWLIKQNIY